jgi:hypothetical protein
MVLYKYFCPERKTFLSDLLIRFTPPGNFNDPFDCLPEFSGFDEGLIKETVNRVLSNAALRIDLVTLSERERRVQRALLAGRNKVVMQYYLSHPSALDEAFISLHRKRIDREIGVVCLCANPNSIVMWSHYAKNHEGFVIGFESKDKFFAHRRGQPSDIGRLKKLDYTNKRPFVEMREIKPGGDMPEYLFVKNKEWSYEREWRVIRFLTDADKKEGDIHLFRVPPSAVREVIFGCRIDPSTMDTLHRSIEGDASLSHVKIFATGLSQSRYQMDIRPWKP